MIPFALLKQIAATEGWWLVYNRNHVQRGWRTPQGRNLRTQAELEAYWASKPPGNPKLGPWLVEDFKVSANQGLAVMSAEGKLLGKLKFCFDSHDEKDAELVSQEPNPVYRYVMTCKLMLSDLPTPPPSDWMSAQPSEGCCAGSIPAGGAMGQ